MISLKDLISLQATKPDGMIIEGSQRNTKIMFHKVDKKRVDINPKYNLPAFEDFQKEHRNVFFAGTDFVFSFWYEGKTARFIGCYKLNEAVKDAIQDEKGANHVRYRFPEMERIGFLADYIDRLYIEWTNPTANYGRYIEDQKYYVHAITPSKDNSIGPLPEEFFGIHISYLELQKLVDYPIDNQEWYTYLSSRCGVYLIYDTVAHKQYIGSAYGELGFWGRWTNYASKTDGNKSFFGRNYEDLQFSIIWETLPNTSKELVVGVESEFKKSLGSRIDGLNNN